MINRKTLLAVAASVVLAALWPSSSFAAQDVLPPMGAGTVNCHGLLLGFGSSHGHPPGLVANAQGISVIEVQAKVDAYCAG